jgi:hypothetical protein
MSPTEAADPRQWNHVWSHQEEGQTRKKKVTLRVGDHVRISKWKGAFEKGYQPNWSEEIFTVTQVDQREAPVTYKIHDYDNKMIEELQKVPPPQWFAVEKMLRRRGTKALVKFLDYPGHYWVKNM